MDIGGTKILTAVVAADGRVLARHRLDTPPRGVEPVLAAVEAGARAALRGAGLA
ncbi:MAG TPA: ROK family protein, partial [bacterium]|nr:ROK family protein [bacterium]